MQTNNRPSLCIVGSTNIDLIFRTPRLPAAGETLAGISLQVCHGGKGANQAVAAVRLGAEVSLLTRVGHDQFGKTAIDHFRAEGIDVSAVLQDAEQPTGTAAIMVDDQGENSIVIVAGANESLSVVDVDKYSRLITRADAVLCQLETPLATCLGAFRLARANQVLTILTPAPAKELPDQLWQACDICLPNRTELARLTGLPVTSHPEIERAAEVLLGRGVKAVVVTLGGDGAVVFDGATAHRIPARTVNPVDTTGAGDAFTAALATAIAAGKSLVDAALFAREVAAWSVTRPGTQPSFPTAQELSHWLEKR